MSKKQTSTPSQPYIVLETRDLSGQQIELEFNRLLRAGYEVYFHDDVKGIFIFRYMPPLPVKVETRTEELEQLCDRILTWKRRTGIKKFLRRHVEYYLRKHKVKIDGRSDFDFIIAYLETHSSESLILKKKEDRGVR
ncbi:MAG: hypothetical protein ACLP5V_03790 [Candidatus Bathyarchaeia archaeon]